MCTHTHRHNRFTALWILSGTTRVSWYQKKHSPTHNHRGHQSSLSASSIYYNPWHPPYSIHVLQPLSTISLQVFFGLPLGLAPSTSYSIVHTFLHHVHKRLQIVSGNTTISHGQCTLQFILFV